MIISMEVTYFATSLVLKINSMNKIFNTRAAILLDLIFTEFKR